MPGRGTAFWRRAGLFATAAVLLVVLAVAGRPLLIQWRLQLAAAAQREEDFELAASYLAAAHRLNPNHPRLHLLLARNHRRQGDTERFRWHLARALDSGCDPEAVYREETLMLAQLGRLRDAGPKLAELLQDPRGDHREIGRAFVIGYLLNLRIEDAERMLNSWELDYPNDVTPHLLRGYAYESISQLRKAEQAYRRGLEIAHDQLDLQIRLAHVLMELRDLDAAREVLEGGRSAEHLGDPRWLAVAARFEHNAGNFTRAKTLLDDLLAREPDNFEARSLLGSIALNEQDFARAIDLLAAAAHQRPWDTKVRYELAKAFQAAGRGDEATPHFDYVAAAEQPLNEMEELLERIMMQPDDPEPRFRVGSILLEFGSPDDAAKWLRSVVELDPQHAAAHAKLADYYQATGELEWAARHRRQAELSNRASGQATPRSSDTP